MSSTEAAQHSDRRHHVERAQPRVHLRQLVGHDALGLGRRALPLAAVAVDDLLQIVDVVEIGVVDALDLGVEVARDGDVDEEDRPARGGASWRAPRRARVMTMPGADVEEMTMSATAR